MQWACFRELWEQFEELDNSKKPNGCMIHRQAVSRSMQETFKTSETSWITGDNRATDCTLASDT